MKKASNDAFLVIDYLLEVSSVAIEAKRLHGLPIW